MEHNFRIFDVPNNMKGKLVVPFFVGDAKDIVGRCTVAELYKG